MRDIDEIVDCAQYMIARYKEIFDTSIDEMKLYKLLYFTQRQSFAEFGRQAFIDDLEVRESGIISIEIKRNFSDGKSKKVSENNKHIISNVIYEYGRYDNWKLDEIIKNEISIQKAIRTLLVEQIGTAAISLDDIRKDAEKIRLYDYEWDMYYDEFDDMFYTAEEDVMTSDR